MANVSVVIITKNEADMLNKSLTLLKQISNDIIVIDNDSTDDTVAVAKQTGCRVYPKTWDGYGANKNKGIQLARHNWILSIDADEIPDLLLLGSISALKFTDDKIVYDISFKSYYGQKLIRFGNWGRDHHIRLFNRTHVKWTEPPVHETLLLPKKVVVKKLEGYLHHYSVKNAREHEAKTMLYSKLSALKYLKSGKKAGFTKLYLAPVFHFVKIYVFLLGFLDGKEGFNIALMTFKNTWLKYHYLARAQQTKQPNTKYQNEQLPVMAYTLNTDTGME